MASTRFIVRGSPIPEDFHGTLNELWQAWLDRLEVISPFGEVSIRIGGLKPTSNVGLWVKDGQKIYVWDEDSKDYIPLDLTDSMPQILGVVNGLLANYYTKAEANAALEAALTAIVAPVIAIINNPVNFSATIASSITTPDLSSGYVAPLAFNTNINGSVPTSVTGGNFVAPQVGWYSIHLSVHHSSASGSPSSLSVVPGLFVNGVGVKAGSLGVDDAFGTTITELHWEGHLAVGDVVSASIDFDSVGAHTQTISVDNTILSGHLCR